MPNDEPRVKPSCAAAASRILIFDGAFGTEIQNWKLTEADYAGRSRPAADQKGNNDILA
jgi:5-methyltetrahydrofolate--homocysteine methyltransferase